MNFITIESLKKFIEENNLPDNVGIFTSHGMDTLAAMSLTIGEQMIKGGGRSIKHPILLIN